MRYVNVPVCLAVSVVVACTSSTTFAKRHRLDQAETKQVLTMLRDRMRTNFEQIGTWQGTWLYEETTVLQSKDYAAYKITSSAETVRQTSKGKIDFVYDRLQNQLFAHASGDDPVFTEGKDGPQLKVASLKSADKFMIFSADQYWHSEVVAYDKEDRQLERMGALEPLQNANRDAGIGNFVQPIQLMSYGGGRPYWESISFLIEHPEIWGQDDQVPKSGLSFWVYEVTENSPTTYSLVVVGPKGPNNSLVIKQEILIHEPAGYNVMCVREFKDDVIVGTQSVSYGKQQGIFIPANVTRTYYTPDKKEQMVRELKLRDSKINESIPADQFEISQLGLKDGEQVEDKIKDCKLVYAGGKLQSQPAP